MIYKYVQGKKSIEATEGKQAETYTIPKITFVKKISLFLYKEEITLEDFG
jgi:hypothetical protein